jgi:nitrite reductase (NADH) large subunit
MKRYVIIGNGVAGATAAEKIRSQDPQGAITLFSDENEPFYYRPRLPDFIAGDLDLARFTLRSRDWYPGKNMELRLGEAVKEVDMAKNEVLSAQGTRKPYDTLLLATGSRSFIPPVTGVQKKGVFALRSFADAQAISGRAKGAKEAVLVGGGLLGLEAGYSLIRLGLKVQVVEFSDWLLPRQMDLRGAKILQTILEGMGFTFYLGARVKEILGTDQAQGLGLEDGRTITGGLILFSAGVRPNLDLAQAMGLAVDKGVQVDDRMQTSREGIYAAGDLVEHRGRLYGIWPAAKAQGEVAGINMAGGSARYEGTLLSNSLKVVGVDLTAAGNIDSQNTLTSAIYEEERAYRKIVLEEGRIVGFIFLGLTAGIKECQAAMERKSEVSGLVPEMNQKDFDFSRLPA